MARIGTRLHGAVAHVITKGTAHDVSACGRVVTSTAGTDMGKRLCRTCVRIDADARRIDDARRKAERDARIAFAGKEAVMEENQEYSWEMALCRAELDATLEKIAKINARCAKRGIPGGLNVEWREEIRKGTNAYGIEIEKIVYPTKITGIAPQLPGWKFIATLDYDSHAGLVVRTYPGVESVDRSRLREGWCDHCQTSRYRRTTYVVREEATGEEVQVGSSCIKDFTGWTALPVSQSRMESDIESMWGGYGGSYDVTTMAALSVAWACVTEYGYKKSRDIGATVDLVRAVLWPPRKIDAEYKAELERLSAHADTMMDRAKEVREFILSDAFSGNSEFVLNMKAITGAERVNSDKLGILCFAPEAWARHQEKTFIKQQEEKLKAQQIEISEWVGEIGERWELSLTLHATRFIESFYGSSTLHTFSDAKGNVFKWFASNMDLTDRIGEVFRVSAGIKAHKEYQNVRETHLTRVKEISAEMAEHKRLKEATVKARQEIPAASLSISADDVYYREGHYWKIRITKGTAYAVLHGKDGWEYVPGAVHLLTAEHVVSAQDAARFGREHRHCVFCSRPLTDDRSTTVGYGPDCAATRGLPWGE